MRLFGIYAISTKPEAPKTHEYTNPTDNLTETEVEEDTIFALSSGAGVTAGVAVIRISGPHATDCLLKISAPSVRPKLPLPRYATVRKLHHPLSKELLDEALVLFFPGPKSFTGEDVVELQVHGSRAVISGVVNALAECSDPETVIRPAERGEFTRRAFENGRLDLTAVEGLADLIAAETAMQRKQALWHLSGHVKETLEEWRTEIKTCLAHVEAVIDFGDDVDDQVFEDIVPRVQALRGQIEAHLNDAHRGEIIRGGARVAIIGKPNAGKSTLLNALARRPAAIVSPHAGTTRDVVEVQLDLNGLVVIVSDTAGLRDSSNDPIEVEGMRRAREAAARADITVLVHDVTEGDLDTALRTLPDQISSYDGGQNPGGWKAQRLVCVLNKVDLVSTSHHTLQNKEMEVFKTSLLRNEGVSELVNHLESMIRLVCEGGVTTDSNENTKNTSENMPIITRARHRHHMKNAVAALDSFMQGRTGATPSLYLPMDLAAEDLRIAGKELGAITGQIDSEEVLDVIFKEFCIGK